MKSFNQMLIDDAERFVTADLEAEQIAFIVSEAEASGCGVAEMAHAGVLTGTAAAMAADGVIRQLSGAVERSIMALVDREQPAALGNAPYGHAPLAAITVVNSATKGISSTEVDCGRSKVRLPVDIGRTPQVRHITAIVEHDPGLMRLEVR